MELEEWVAARGGIVHRDAARQAGWTEPRIRSARVSKRVQMIRRTWIATSAAPGDALAAARGGARIACLSLARERGWWMPEGVDSRRHLSLPPHARAGTLGEADVVHWSKPVAPASRHSLREPIEDALAHIASCADPESARALWESAVRIERLSPEALRRVRWTTRAAARLAGEVTGLADSGLESLFLSRLAPWDLQIRHQVVLAGRRVDFLIGETLVIQVDGFAHHSTAAERGRDVAHDAELSLRGYTVLRFTYAQVVHEWPSVERAIARAVAAGLHRARR